MVLEGGYLIRIGMSGKQKQGGITNFFNQPHQKN
jgi:hypothetical protein